MGVGIFLANTCINKLFFTAEKYISARIPIVRYTKVEVKFKWYLVYSLVSTQVLTQPSSSSFYTTCDYRTSLNPTELQRQFLIFILHSPDVLFFQVES